MVILARVEGGSVLSHGFKGAIASMRAKFWGDRRGGGLKWGQLF